MCDCNWCCRLHSLRLWFSRNRRCRDNWFSKRWHKVVPKSCEVSCNDWVGTSHWPSFQAFWCIRKNGDWKNSECKILRHLACWNSFRELFAWIEKPGRWQSYKRKVDEKVKSSSDFDLSISLFTFTLIHIAHGIIKNLTWTLGQLLPNFIALKL